MVPVLDPAEESESPVKEKRHGLLARDALPARDAMRRRKALSQAIEQGHKKVQQLSTDLAHAKFRGESNNFIERCAPAPSTRTPPRSRTPPAT